MKIFTKSQQKIKKILIFVILVLFILIWLFREDWQINSFYLQILMFIVAYALGLFLMLGDEKYLQKIYSEELEQKILITRSPLFLIALPFLSIFMLTSTGSIAGIALILALNLVVLIEIYQLAPQTEKFNQYFLMGVEKKLAASDIKIIKIICFFYFLILLFLLFKY
jgi:hypothetical protein